MKFKVATVWFLSVAALVAGASPSAHAYDIDVHFYQTYSMARYAGLRHEAAALIAASAQWPDETQVIASPFIDPKMRRLFHFPCDAQGRSIDGNTMGQKTDHDDDIGKAKATHVQWCETTPDNDMAWYLMYEGLCHSCDRKTNEMLFSESQKGDLLKAATSLHTIEDSFAHAGTPSEAGHAPFGHWPDRPYNPNGSIPKFYKMIDSAMQGVVALRETLLRQKPYLCDESTRDPRAVVGTKPEIPNCKRTAEQLAIGYKSLPILHQTIEHNTLKDPFYVEHVVRWALVKMKDIEHSDDTGRMVSWLNPNFDVLKWLDRQEDILTMMRSGQYEVRAVMYKLFPRLFYLEPTEVSADLWLDRASPMRNFVAIRFLLLGMKNWLTISDSVRPTLEALDKKVNDADVQIRALRKLKVAAADQKANQMATAREGDLAAREQIRQKIADESAARKCRERDYACDTQGHSARMMKELIDDALRVDVPRMITDAYHLFEYENDGAFPRHLELQMRTVAVREMIQKLYGTNVRFIPNKNEWDSPAYQAAHADQAKDFVPEDPLVVNIVPSHLQGPVAQVTYNYEQIKRWNDDMVRFSYPLLADHFVPKGAALPADFIMAFEDLVQVDEKLKELKDQAGDLGYGDIWKLASEGLAVKSFLKKYGGWKNLWHLFQKDYLTTRLMAPDDMTVKLKDDLQLSLDKREFYVTPESLGYIDNAIIATAAGKTLDGSKTFFNDPAPFALGQVRQKIEVRVNIGKL